jgi:hypothetical protein
MPQAAPTTPSEFERVSVTLQVRGLQFAAGSPVVRLPLIVSNVDTAASQISDMTARDEKGSLQLAARDVMLPEENARDAGSGGPSREWIVDRASVGPVAITYTVAASATLPPRGPAPPFAFSNDGGGVSAAGEVFLALPPDNRRYRTTISWDLSKAPEGSRGVSSLGEGTVTAGDPLTREEIQDTFFMAGRIGTWPSTVPRRGFFATWQGHPPFDAASLMAWTGELYGHYSKFFGQQVPPPYGVFLRYNPINAGGGVGLHQSFVTTFGAGQDFDMSDLKDTLAHEMFHTFSPYIDEPVGTASSWFGEGLAVFYSSRLALRFHAITPADFLKNLN